MIWCSYVYIIKNITNQYDDNDDFDDDCESGNCDKNQNDGNLLNLFKGVSTSIIF